MTKEIRLAKSCIGEREKQAVLAVLDHEFLGMGAEVNEFELLLKQFFSRPSICVINGTAALHLALEACGVGVGDEVLLPSLTYVASFQAVAATGATPVACDIDPIFYTLDPSDAELRITSRTKAIMPVHYAGGVGSLREIYQLAESNGLRVIEDAAHAFGTTLDGNRVGSFGDIACFSFDGIKNITSGEGGCITSADDDLLDKISRYRSLGISTRREADLTAGILPDFDVCEKGWRYHMSNVMAAIGIQQFHRRSELADTRRELAKAYDGWLGGAETISLIPNNYNEVVPFMYPIKIAEDQDVSALRASLHADGIPTGAQYQPNHSYELFSISGQSPLPVIENLYPRLVTLPLHPDLTINEVEYISKKILANLRN